MSRLLISIVLGLLLCSTTLAENIYFLAEKPSDNNAPIDNHVSNDNDKGSYQNSLNISQEKFQKEFVIYGEIEYPVKLEKSILDNLGNINKCEETDEKIDITLKLVASYIYLNDDAQRDLFVMPIGPEPCMGGAAEGAFLIYLNKRGSYELMLETGGLKLLILNTKSNGFRDISVISKTGGMGCISLYTFNSMKYIIKAECEWIRPFDDIKLKGCANF